MINHSSFKHNLKKLKKKKFNIFDISITKKSIISTYISDRPVKKNNNKMIKY